MMRQLLIISVTAATLCGVLLSRAVEAAEAKPKSRTQVDARTRTAPTYAIMTFNDYMSKNANHPALNSRVQDHQNAFVDTRAPASITFPTEGSSVKDTAPPAATTASAASPAPAPGDQAQPAPNH